MTKETKETRDANGWKLAIILGDAMIGLLVGITLLEYNSTSCIEDSLNEIQVSFAEHMGEHKGITDRIKKLEAKATIHVPNK